MPLICQYLDTYPYSVRRISGTNFPQWTRDLYSEITNLQAVNAGSLNPLSALNVALVSPGISTKIFIMSKVDNDGDTLQFDIELFNGLTNAGTYRITAGGTKSTVYSIFPLFINFPITILGIRNTSASTMKFAIVGSTAFLDGNINDVVNDVNVQPAPFAVFLVDPALINNFPIDIVTQSGPPVLVSATIDNPLPLPVDINSSVPIDTNSTIIAPLPLPVIGGGGGDVMVKNWEKMIEAFNQSFLLKYADPVSGNLITVPLGIVRPCGQTPPNPIG